MSAGDGRPTLVSRVQRVGVAYAGFWTATDGPLSHGLAMIAVPAVLGFLGSLLDRVLATGPLFLVTLALLGAGGSFLSAWYRYRGQIHHEGIGRPWTRRPERDGAT